jgi:hypothetical protein
MRTRALPSFSLLAVCICGLQSGCAGSGGCLIPYASIPARVEIGGISAHGSIPTGSQGEDESDSAYIFHLRAGINPLQGFNGWHDRSWDVGAGYLAQFYWPEDADSLVFHGFHLEGAYFPLNAEAGQTSMRLGLIGNAEVILSDFTSNAEIGPGLSVGALIELSGTAEEAQVKSTGGGLGSSAGSIGAWYGEWGVGLGVSAGYRRLYDRDFLTVFVGLSIRLPFGAGLVGLSS